MDALQQAVVRQGREILRRMQRNGGGGRKSRHTKDFIMRWSMRNEPLKTQLFKLVDVLPSLSSDRAVAAHTRDYLAASPELLPPLARWGVELGSRVPFATSAAARIGVGQMARTFILAESPEESIGALRKMRDERVGFTVDLLGETVLSEHEAGEYAARYAELIETLANESGQWDEQPLLDRDSTGTIPKVNVSIKISALYSQIRPTAPEAAREKLGIRLRPILRSAKERGVFVNFDMEHTALKTLTIDLFLALMSEPEFADWNECGLVVQAYLKSAAEDLARIIDWAKEHGRRPTVRLVKGAYWDTEVILARQRGWPVPVFTHKLETDANYESLTRVLLENPECVRGAFATHNVRSVAYTIAAADELGVPKEDLEFQCLYGMAGGLVAALPEMGYRVRQYCPIGRLLPGMAYLVRRLLENTSNEGFLRASVTHAKSEAELLKNPSKELPGDALSREAAAFANAPLADFTIASNREEFRAALRHSEGQLGRRYAMEIDGKATLSKQWITSINPAHPRQIIGTVASADVDDAKRAIVAARRSSKAWAKLTFKQRAEILHRVADTLHRRRFEFAALEVLEVGKPWEEADADVAEAIDFCRFYAVQAFRLEPQEYPVPGEQNIHEYHPRGVGVVIAPWNFPLAILCGMTVAGLVTGNSVIMKPAEQSPVIAEWFFQVLRECGVPGGVIQFLPGLGEEVGPALVGSAGIDWVAFTGSKEVGLKIWEQAGRTLPGQRQLKHVVCEMGGKNAIIVDDDADLDEAVPGILTSAFGFCGQKCSALSRLIVLEGIYDRLMRRLVDAAADMAIGDPRDPQYALGPLVDAAARDRVKSYLAEAQDTARIQFKGKVPESEGFFVAPTILDQVDPDSRIAREEIFGPVLCVFRVRDFGEAIRLANDSEFHLTGGIYSRSPASIATARRQFDVGNLYINRGITGALVGRHPFGGHGMSGGGTKAGGPDYLLNFVVPRTVSENLMRHGFAGQEPLESSVGL